MDRRRFLAGVAVLVGPLAGCSGRGEETTRPRASRTRTAADSLAQSPSSPAPSATPSSESPVDVPPCPDRPDEFTRETAAEFSVKFERSYVARRILGENARVTYVRFPSLAGVGGRNADATRTENGYLVRFSVEPAFGFRSGSDDRGTVHADLERYTVTYFVSGRDVRRAEATGSDDPREYGTPVSCPPE